MELLDLEKARLFLVLAVPGIVILYMRSQFLTGRMLSLMEGLIAYVTVSLVYYALVLPAFAWLEQRTGIAAAALWFLIVLAGPAIVGALLGLNVRKGWSQKVLRRLGISTVHPISAAWDWRFSGGEACWVLAILKNGTRWAGYLGTNSFMSSDPSERDIYIQQVYELDSKSQWTPRDSSVWIAHGEIQSLEFWPDGKTQQQEKAQP
ncbi:DUF6338 family protein [Sphingopyxis indica]|uniref:Uncharacterized protein n=1 Tax=Sphingopyxis indica TaxID=436663 RepID=A0A239JTZ9_9SPHN|nr:DUF6338 family protein [Sphingopyxis indica]SNT08354.1 hypothetical protein SAMN06295955_11133 [Sphingopyxis indica]